jgi:hypothetical protein
MSVVVLLGLRVLHRDHDASLFSEPFYAYMRS